MTNLYPIKFEPIIKERVWGGDKLIKIFEKDYRGGKAVGESWEISTVNEDISVITNGFLRGNNLEELLESYMGDITGDKIYDKYGNEFPLLIKYLDITENLSVQVHPNDIIAGERHGSLGKSECWYIIDAEKDSKIFCGFNRDTTKEEFLQLCKEQKLEEIMNVIHPQKGDFLFIEPGTLHSASGGVFIAEVQQSSDITYRVYDWGREHNPETAREMHLELALDCINFNKLPLGEKVYKRATDSGSERINLNDSTYFKVDKINVKGRSRVNSVENDGFIIYLCLEGDILIASQGGSEVISPGETILIPSVIDTYFLEKLTENAVLLEVTGK